MSNFVCFSHKLIECTLKTRQFLSAHAYFYMQRKIYAQELRAFVSNSNLYFTFARAHKHAERPTTVILKSIWVMLVSLLVILISTSVLLVRYILLNLIHLATRNSTGIQINAYDIHGQRNVITIFSLHCTPGRLL